MKKYIDLSDIHHKKDGSASSNSDSFFEIQSELLEVISGGFPLSEFELESALYEPSKNQNCTNKVDCSKSTNKGTCNPPE